MWWRGDTGSCVFGLKCRLSSQQLSSHSLRPRSPPAFCADKLCVLVREATAVVASDFGSGAVGASGARAASARSDCGQPSARPPLDGTGPRLIARGGRE